MYVGDGAGATGVFNYNTAHLDNGVLAFPSGGSLVVGNAGTGTLNIGSTSNTTDLNLQTSGTLLDVGAQAGGYGTVNLAAGSSLEDDAIVGDAGTGMFNNSGTHTVGTTAAPENLILGNQATGVGFYNDNAGAVTTVNGELIVGAAGTGNYTLGDGVGGATLNVNGTGLQGDVFIGESGTGTFLAQSGSQATVQGVVSLGGPSGQTSGIGTLTVTGAGTSFISGSQAIIGAAGTGYLYVQSGGYFESDPNGGNPSSTGTSGVIGGIAGANGYATVDGTSDGTPTTPSEWYNGGALRVGAGGSGNLTISNGGLVVDNADPNGVAASVGWQGGSSGIVAVQGGSTWTNNGNLNIGDGGTGTVTLYDTSTINISGNLDVGTQTTGNGTLTLEFGTNFASNETYVGDAGTGVISNLGGTHTVTGDLILGNNSTGNGAYTLTGGGALNVSGYTFVGAQGQGTFTNDASNHNTQILVVAAGPASTGLYTLDGNGTLTVGAPGSTGFADIGEQGYGTFTQTGYSSNTTTIYGALDIGRFAGGTGTLNLQGGTIEVAEGFAVVGDAGTGYVNQSGGSFTVDSGGLAIGRGESLAVGAPVTGTGTYTLSAGQLNVTGGLALGFLAGNTGSFVQTGGGVAADSEYVGLVGVGDWNQSGGSNTTASLSIGNNTGGTGTYELSGGGTLTATNEYVGAEGNGTLTQTGGSNATSYFVIGNNAGGVGLYTLSAGTLTNTGDTYLGGDVGAQGTLNQTGGTATFGGNVLLGLASSGATSTIALGGAGAMTIGGNLDIGVESGSHGEFDFNTAPGDTATLAFPNGGALSVGDGGTGVFRQGGGDLNLTAQGVYLDIGVQAGSYGAYILTGGTLEDDLFVGDAGTGAFANSGGVHTVHGNLVAGNQSTGVGTYTLGGSGNLTLADAGAQIILGNAAGATGTFNFNTAPGDNGAITFGAGQSLIVGASGHGTFAQGGGDLNLAGAGVPLEIAQNAGSSGFYNLYGTGTLETSGGLKVGDGGSGKFDLSGTASATVNGDLVAGSQGGASVRSTSSAARWGLSAA